MFWLAGFYEGEGSCGFYENKSKKCGILVASITQNEKEPLLRIKEILGLGNVCGGKSRKCYTFQVSGKGASDFLCKISPYLQTKRKKDQLNKAMSDYINRKLGKRVKSPVKSAVAINRTRNSNGRFEKEVNLITSNI